MIASFSGSSKEISLEPSGLLFIVIETPSEFSIVLIIPQSEVLVLVTFEPSGF
ncbi:hypothetical protein HOG21_02545 [bacterium]|nr:hypothetical protein [bacterium]